MSCTGTSHTLNQTYKIDNYSYYEIYNIHTSLQHHLLTIGARDLDGPGTRVRDGLGTKNWDGQTLKVYPVLRRLSVVLGERLLLVLTSRNVERKATTNHRPACI